MTQATDSLGLDSLEPALVWRFFAGIAGVPRPSKKEARILAHLRSVAQSLGFPVRQDAAGNLVVEVPPSPGWENARVTVLQGHVDMVCEKNTGTSHDFDHDPIRLRVENDATDGELVVRAEGTTLGADNGIGIALALAAASSPDVAHGPLELLLTIDEEAGMTGAKALESDFLRGRRLLNLDAEQDDTIYIGCAGGCDATLTLEFATGSLPAVAEVCRVGVTGLRGGHSGGDIHLNRANAIKVLAQVLRDMPESQIQVIELTGGSRRNVIPREAWALVAGPTGTTEGLTQAAERARDEVVREAREPHCDIRVEAPTGPDVFMALSREDTQRLLATLVALPHGVLAVEPEIPGLVQTSNNLATVTPERDPGTGRLRLVLSCMPRSSAAAGMRSTVRQIAAVGYLAGATVTSGNEYPGWKPNLDSPTLRVCRGVYERLFGHPAKVTAVHAGLECGIIGERIVGMDMISFGPRIEGAHSPDERVYVESVQKSWRYLTTVLGDLARA